MSDATPEQDPRRERPLDEPEPGLEDRETLLERLRVSESKRALAEAQLTLARVAKAPGWQPSDDGHADVADRLRSLGPALDVFFHTAKAAMVLVTPDSTILRANQAAADLFGRPLAELPGQRTLDMTPEEDVAVTDERLLQADEAQFLLKTYLRPDGTPVPVLALGWPLIDDDGATTCLIGVAVSLAHLVRAPSVIDAVLSELRPDPD